MAGPGFSKVFFTLGGAEANENAIKIARQVTGRLQDDRRYRSYHGASMGALALTGDWRRPPIEPLIPGVTHVPGLLLRSLSVRPARRDLQARVRDEHRRRRWPLEGARSTAAVFLEPVPGRERRARAAARVLAARPRGVRSRRRTARRRRGADRVRSHRQAVRLPALGCRAGPHHGREGARVGLRDDRRGDRSRARREALRRRTCSPAASRTTLTRPHVRRRSRP